MNQNDNQQAAKIIIAAVTGAIEDKIEVMLDYLGEAFEAVEADDHGNKKASITIPIKLKLQRSARLGDTYSAKAIVKKVDTEIGECEMTFNPDQPELPMQQEAAPVPEREAFYDRMAAVGVEADELDNYFAGSNRWNDFEGWIAAGNGLDAAKIMADDTEAADFANLIEAALNPAGRE